jgi:hypothetical protein
LDYAFTLVVGASLCFLFSGCVLSHISRFVFSPVLFKIEKCLAKAGQVLAEDGKTMKKQKKQKKQAKTMMMISMMKLKFPPRRRARRRSKNSRRKRLPNLQQLQADLLTLRFVRKTAFVIRSADAIA